MGHSDVGQVLFSHHGAKGIAGSSAILEIIDSFSVLLCGCCDHVLCTAKDHANGRFSIKFHHSNLLSAVCIISEIIEHGTVVGGVIFTVHKYDTERIIFNCVCRGIRGIGNGFYLHNEDFGGNRNIFNIDR